MYPKKAKQVKKAAGKALKSATSAAGAAAGALMKKIGPRKADA